METPSSSESPDGENQPRKLIVKACDMCRKKKIRCDPSIVKCLQCIKYKTDCHFTPISVKRKPRRLPGQKRIEDLEERLKRMESQLKQATERKQAEEANPTMEIVSQREIPSGGGQFGASTANNLALGKGITLEMEVNSQGFDSYYQKMLYQNSTSGKRISPDGKLPMSVLSRRSFKPLPSKEEADYLIRSHFVDFNSAVPIFDTQSVLDMLDHPHRFHEDMRLWASLNVILAFSYRFRSMRSIGSGTANDREAMGYLHNAMESVTELNRLQPTISSVQALLGLALLIQGCPDSRPYSNFLSQAIRMGQAIGLNRATSEAGLNVKEIEQRRKVFWIAYFQDKDYSLRTGRPPAQDDDEMDVGLPFQSFESTHEGGLVNFFHIRTRLAIIQGRIYKRLYSIKSQGQSVVERMFAAKELEVMLLQWKAEVPIDFNSEYLIPPSETNILSPILHTVILRLAYFNSLYAIHQAFPVEKWREQVHETIDPRVVHDPPVVHAPPPPITCVDEGRMALKLMNTTPQGDYPCIWVVLHVFVSASTTLLNNILLDLTDPLVNSDLALITPLIKLLSYLVSGEGGKNDDVCAMYHSCVDLYESTRLKVVTAQKQQEMGRLNAPKGHRESVEDFIRRIEGISSGRDEYDQFSQHRARMSSGEAQLQEFRFTEIIGDDRMTID